MKIGIMATDFVTEPFHEICEKARSYGAEFVEIVHDKNLKLQQVHEAKSTLEQFGLEPVLVHVLDLNAAGPELIRSREIFRETIDMCKILNSKVIVTYCHAQDEADVRSYAGELRPFAKECASLGITIAIENEPFGVTKTAEGMKLVLDIVAEPNVGTNYDPNNFYNALEEGFPYAYEILKDRIAHIHAKDSKKYRKDLYGDERILERGITAMCVPVGEGAMNWDALSARLKADGYDGFIGIEPHMKPERLDECFSQGIAYLKARLR